MSSIKTIQRQNIFLARNRCAKQVLKTRAHEKLMLKRTFQYKILMLNSNYHKTALKRFITRLNKEAQGRVIYNHATYRRFFINGLNHELLVVEGNVSNFAPRKTDFRSQPAKIKIRYLSKQKRNEFNSGLELAYKSVASDNHYVLCLLVCFFIDVQTESVDTEKKFSMFLVLDIEVIDSVHFQILFKKNGVKS